MTLAVAEQGRRQAVDVVARDRPREAHQLHLAGVDWTTVAQRTGYASGRVAKLRVDAYLQKIAVELGPEHRRHDLQLELARLDAIMAAFWLDTMGGDRHAAEVVLKVIARRCKIMGFDKPDESMLPAPRTVLVTGTSEEYVATLKSLIDGTA